MWSISLTLPCTGVQIQNILSQPVVILLMHAARLIIRKNFCDRGTDSSKEVGIIIEEIQIFELFIFLLALSFIA